MKKMVSSLAGYFLSGLLFVAPIGITVAVIVWFVRLINGLISPLTEQFTNSSLTVIGLVVVIALLTLLGYAVSHFINVSAVNWIEKLLSRTPLVKVIYFSVKDIISLFSDKEEKLGRPVKVRMQKDPAQFRLGFVTQSDLSTFGFRDDMISVYLPLSYGIVGNQMVVHRDDVEFLDLPTTEVMKFIVSGGVTHINTKGKDGAQQ
jgi:uncharacterized membrane protein